MKKIGFTDVEVIWKFIRGDLPAKEFEQWIYLNKDLEEIFEKGFYFQIISTLFDDRSQVFELKRVLREYVESEAPLKCECSTISDLDVLDMGNEKWSAFFSSVKEIKKFGDERWWLRLWRCEQCTQYWLVASEEMQNDIDCVLRLMDSEGSMIIESDRWPPFFSTYEELLRIGQDRGRSVTFLDPFSSSSLEWTIQDLRTTRSDITMTEVASLLNISDDVVKYFWDKKSDSK